MLICDLFSRGGEASKLGLLQGLRLRAGHANRKNFPETLSALCIPGVLRGRKSSLVQEFPHEPHHEHEQLEENRVGLEEARSVR